MPVLKKPVPQQVVNEGAAFRPLDLAEFIEGCVRFQAEITDGNPLPKGLICTSEGIISGIPAEGTQGSYKIKITGINVDDETFTLEFDLIIKARPTKEDVDFYNKIKTQVWEALGNDLPIPELADLLNREITPLEIYYLLQRFATLTIWDVYNLDAPREKKLLTLEGMNQHYNIYDRGSCIVATPKDLFSYERTLEDALQTARVMAREVYKRGWVIEFAGFDKMVRAAWVELQHLGDKFGKSLEIMHFSPSVEDVKIYSTEQRAKLTNR